MKTCPKCNYEGKSSDTECPKCGIIYDKYEKYILKKEIEKKTIKEKESKTANADPVGTQPKIKKIYFFVLLIVLILFTAIVIAAVSQGRSEKLKEKNEQLIAALDECKYGAEKIIAEVEKAYAEKKYNIARQNIKLLYERHPESTENSEYVVLLKQIESEELVENERKAAEEKKRIRLANIKNTGIWKVVHLHDKSGEHTYCHIINSSSLEGTFSNTATQDSRLKIKFLIYSSNDIEIKLYEYAGNNPVKTNYSIKYRVSYFIGDEKLQTSRGVNSYDSLQLDKTTSKKVHNALMKADRIYFVISEVDAQTTKYKFTIPKSDWYENAYRQLTDS